MPPFIHVLLACTHALCFIGLSHLCSPLHHKSTSAVSDCSDVLQVMGNVSSGFYDVVQPNCATSSGASCTKRVYCDMTTEGGGWTVIQQRQTGSVNFFVPWNEYKLGFGDDNEFWTGNEYVYALTSRSGKTYDLMIAADDENANRLVSRYSAFQLAPEASFYQLSYNTYLGNYTIDNLNVSRNQRFGTYDVDTDSLQTVTCGAYWRSGWWFEPTCLSTGDLNLPYTTSIPNGPQFSGILWRTDTQNVRLVRTQMKIKPTVTTSTG